MTPEAESRPALPLTDRLRDFTPARVGLRRTGQSLATAEVLDFQFAHARARDAVHATLQPTSLRDPIRSLSGEDPILLHSAAANRQIYLQRPDLGRKIELNSQKKLQGRAPDCDLAIVLADGLSALAIERHAIPLLAALLPLIAEHGLRLGPICIVEQGRVAIGDSIGEALATPLVVVLIGERPGLTSPDSLGAYITWLPQRAAITDAERNCISNIRPEGLSYTDAAVRLMHYIQQARRLQLTGTILKDPDPHRPAALS